ncbi:hypothetical protein KAJ27_01610 [bacterium]|nr:hypothetical protein [bacterium]
MKKITFIFILFLFIVTISYPSSLWFFDNGDAGNLIHKDLRISYNGNINDGYFMELVATKVVHGKVLHKWAFHVKDWLAQFQWGKSCFMNIRQTKFYGPDVILAFNIYRAESGYQKMVKKEFKGRAIVRIKRHFSHSNRSEPKFKVKLLHNDSKVPLRWVTDNLWAPIKQEMIGSVVLHAKN